MKLLSFFLAFMLVGCSNNSLFTAEEEAFLEDHGPITFGAKYHPPYIYINEKGEAQGVTKEYLDLLTARTGVVFKIKETGQLDVLLDLLRQGRIDMVVSLRETPERAQYANFSKPYVTTPLRLFYKTSVIVMDPKPTVATVRPFSVTQHLELNGFPVFPTFDDDESLNLLLAGKVDAVAMDAGTANYLFKLRPGMQPLNSVPYPFEYPLALAYTREVPMLKPILAKIQSTVSDKEMQDIADKWSTTQIDIKK